MLRALASYFFGGIEDESPEAPIECETREVSDWLVVNLPDQNKDSVDLNEDDDAYEIDEEDVRKAMDDDDPVEVDESDMIEVDVEDDILLSLSFLMSSTEQLSSELSNNEFVHETEALEKPCLPKYIQPILCPYSILDTDNQILADTGLSIVQDSVPTRMMNYYSCVNVDDSQKKALSDSDLSARILAHRDIMINELKMHLRGPLKMRDFIVPPTYSKNYVNHRHPEKLLNQDLLQRIKELEPEQQALQQLGKKNLTRGLLNRQNKNYMYETSSKKNRRCNRQRNHSGANNNRKC